ncbi:Cof-type HAD-IIB family hydrolase [Amphibacillus sp. MSJ-3]|uniref:HAD family hydrolase n=1 Tax=Amphibacillus sp. MSJ-3 TaxID=2841505 RepID=UPI001C0EB13A|nr:Cof-type HAD-IIB family hydrolase [Amphibacillus sp. MSJ-3]MBU5595014.1 Cof-type HAD-IIB family hydrolase [Amphibacillus sp. MSJ-3]
MVKEIKLLALDLDGTVVEFNGDSIAEETIEAVKQAQEKGVEVIIATGRSRRTSIEIAEKLGVEYMVTLNGGEIWTRSGELLKSQALDRETVEKIMTVYQQYQSNMWLVSHDHIFRNEYPDHVLEQEWLKIGFNVIDDADREKMKQEFALMDRVELSNSSLTNMELNPKGVHKANAIQFLLDRLGFSFDQVMAIGDSMNDFKMIQAAGLGIAMGNAQDRVKNIADWVTTSNDAHGVAVAIKKFIID